MTDAYPIPLSTVRIQREIRRSRFIATLQHAPTADAARAFIQRTAAEFADASHNCWAYVAGPPGSTADIGCSDDGEPHGSAGQPMLKVLLYAEVGEIAAVVTRYFGGTKLGVGGLVRAYSGGVQAALAELPTTLKVERSHLRITVDYALLTPVQNHLPRFEAEIEATEFAEQVKLRIVLPTERETEFRAWFTDLTRGAGQAVSLPS